MLTTYFKHGESVAEVLRKWRTFYGPGQKPSRSCVEKLVKRFYETGSVADNIEAKKTKRVTVRTPEMIDAARDILINNSSISVSELARELDTSQSSAYKMMRKDLNLHPYKVQMLQRIDQASEEKRMQFATDFCELIDTGKVDINKIIFTDEAHFWLDGYVNSQNYRIWGSEKPEMPRTKPLHPKKVTVWAGITGSGLLGPIFFRERETVTAASYQKVLAVALAEAESKGWTQESWHWQQDGATPHCTTENLQFINDAFEGRVISRKFPQKFGKGIEWPPYSPDLSPMDFFLWGSIKDKVYKKMPQDLVELQARIEREMRSVTRATCVRTMANFEKRLRLVISKEGSHVEDILQ